MSNQDRISELYKGEILGERPAEIARRRLHWMRDRASGRTLDLGCSQGMLSILIGRAGNVVVGVDVEIDRLQYAVRDLAAEPGDIRKRVGFAGADGASLPFSDGTFDTVVLGEIVEHLDDPGPVLTEAARVLTPDGVAVLTTPLGYHPHHDHRRSLYPGVLVELLRGTLRPEAFDFADGYIFLTARPGSATPEEEARLLLETLPAFEAEMLLREQDRWRFVDKASQLRERVRLLEGQRDKLREQRDQMRQEQSSLKERFRNAQAALRAQQAHPLRRLRRLARRIVPAGRRT